MDYYLAVLSFLLQSVSSSCTFLMHNHTEHLPRINAFILNEKRALVVCRDRCTGPLMDSLQIRCKNVNRYRRLTTVDVDEPALITSRLVVGRRQIVEDISMGCYCINFYSGKKSNITEVPKQNGVNNIGTSPKNDIRPYFSPNRNRKRTVKYSNSLRFIWRYKSLNSSLAPECFHDGQPLIPSHEYTDLKGKVVTHFKNVSEKHAGFYSCTLRVDSNHTIYSSIFTVYTVADNPWSQWYTWFPCSVKCGTGRRIEARKCLSVRRRGCDGPNVRTESCFKPCTEIHTTNQPKYTIRTTTVKHVTNSSLHKVKIPRLQEKNGGHDIERILVITLGIPAVLCCLTVLAYSARKHAQERIKRCSANTFTTTGIVSGCAQDSTSKNMSPPSFVCRTDTVDSYIDDDLYAGDAFESLRSCKDCSEIRGVRSFDDGQDADVGCESVRSCKDCVEIRDVASIDTPDVDLCRQGSSKSKVSAFSTFSSISHYCCPKPTLPETINPDLCAWGRFDEKGGKLTIKGTGVSLYIPKMALPEGTSKIIYIGLMSDSGVYSELRDDQTALSPAVICGPDGMQFDSPVHLTLPHNAAKSISAKSCKPQVFSCSTVPQDENDAGQWKVLEDPEDREPPLGHISNRSVQIMVDHFTGFVIVGTPAEIESWIVPFYTEPKVDMDCSVRVYCIPATDAALEELHNKEKRLKNGTMGDSWKLLMVQNNDRDVVVAVERVREGWSADELEQNIPFRDIWHHYGRCPNVSFTFERKSKDQFSFSSNFTAKQGQENENSVTVKVTTSIKRQSLNSSGYSTLFDSGYETDIAYKIPLNVRKELCYLLDIDNVDFKDWRILAENLGQRKRYIDWLTDIKLKQGRSPTNEIIEWWEKTKSEEIPLPKLIEILEDMGRHDAVDELMKIGV